MRNYKVLFLDIDGVLATQGVRYNHFDPACVAELNWVFEAVPGLKLVLSSTWRLGLPVSAIRKMMYNGFGPCRDRGTVAQENGVLRDAIIGATPRIYDVPRGAEIQEWFEQVAGMIEVEAFVILDDDSDMEPYMANLVQTDPYTGMSREHADEVIARLAVGERRLWR